jgi:hypothetical protein
MRSVVTMMFALEVVTRLPVQVATAQYPRVENVDP